MCPPLRILRTIISLLVILVIFLFIFALLGMQFFGGSFPNDVHGNTERPNFDNIWAATLTVFQCLTGEDWNEVMYASIDAKGGIDSSAAAYALYYLVLIIIGSYVVINVFLAIAVDSLEGLRDVIEEIARVSVG